MGFSVVVGHSWIFEVKWRWAVIGVFALAGPCGAEVDFNFEVRPILSDRCYFCHGAGCRESEGWAASGYARRGDGETERASRRSILRIFRRVNSSRGSHRRIQMK